MMHATGKLFVCSKTSEVMELIFTDDGDFMYDGIDTFHEVKKSDYDDEVYYNVKDTRQFFIPADTEGEQA